MFNSFYKEGRRRRMKSFIPKHSVSRNNASFMLIVLNLPDNYNMDVESSG